MASNMSIKIEATDGAIEGEYLEKEGEIEVWSWSWNLSHSGTTHHGKGGGQGTLNVADLSFTKPIDKSTPPLMRMLCRGTAFTSAILTVRKAGGGDSAFDYLIIEMMDGVISSITPAGAHGQDIMTETVTLNFPKFKTTYVCQDAGNTPGSSVPMSWDITTKKAM